MVDNIFLPDAESIAYQIPDGATLAIFKDCGVAMDVTRALIRRGVRGLHLVTVPTSSFQAEILIATNCVETIETSGVTMWEQGQAPAFVRAVKSGAVRIIDSTCPAIYAQIQAGEKGIPFIPIRGLIGSDIMAKRDDYKIIDNPFAEDDPVVVLPAIVPDVTIFHAPKADRTGNIWVGRQVELKMLAHASRQTFVTVEEVVDEDLMADEVMAGGTISSFYISGVATAQRGAWPLGLPGYYDDDHDYLAHYCQAAADELTLASWLHREGFSSRTAAE